MDEFKLIKEFFDRSHLQNASEQVVLGIGDDCSIIDCSNAQLAQSIDTLVEGRHFPKNCHPDSLGYRALAVCISDLAAMGAKPNSFFLALTLPHFDNEWLLGFSNGLAQAAQKFGVSLIGGDTTKGDLTITVQVQGCLPKNQGLKRSTAKADDLIYVSGCLGDAAGALPFVLGKGLSNHASGDVDYLLGRYFFPEPRIGLGQWLLKNGATSAIDLSDGLMGDLRHILTASQVSAVVDLGAIPKSKPLMDVYLEHSQALALSGGDDYELCFTWPADKKLALPADLDIRLTCIGSVLDNKRCAIIDQLTGNDLFETGYQHF